jgi:hypothetical protein
MNRRLILLNLALVALGGSLGWLLRERWLETHAHERAIVEQPAHPRPVLAPPQVAPLKPVTGAEYIDVAQKDLFTKDRNPNVIIDAPPPPPPPPPMPALPSYFGQMRIGEPSILLTAAANEPQKSYHTGDKVGPFEIVSFDYDKIALKWNGKTIERPFAELAPKEAPPEAARAAAAPAQPRAQPRILGASTEPAKADPQIGADMGAGFHGCVIGDPSPSGTIVNGYKKVVSMGLMGQSCHWELVNK